MSLRVAQLGQNLTQ
jgi:glycerol-3-phosphate dehydrogenase